MFGLAVVFIYTDTRKLLHEKNVIIQNVHFTADQLPVFCVLLSAPGEYCSGYLLYIIGNIIGNAYKVYSFIVMDDYGRFWSIFDVCGCELIQYKRTVCTKQIKDQSKKSEEFSSF